jgi:hypothetical protein
MTSMCVQVYVTSEMSSEELPLQLFQLSFVYLVFDIGLAKLSERQLVTLPMTMMLFLVSQPNAPLNLTTTLSLSVHLTLYLLLTLHALREQERSEPSWARPSAPPSEGSAPQQLSVRLPLNPWATLSARSRLFVMWCLSAPLSLSLTLSASAHASFKPPSYSLTSAVTLYVGLISVALIKSELAQFEAQREGKEATRDARRKRHIIATACLTLACAVYASQLL